MRHLLTSIDVHAGHRLIVPVSSREKPLDLIAHGPGVAHTHALVLKLNKVRADFACYSLGARAGFEPSSRSLMHTWMTEITTLCWRLSTGLADGKAVLRQNSADRVCNRSSCDVCEQAPECEVQLLRRALLYPNVSDTALS
jgi:hypothetical protein